MAFTTHTLSFQVAGKDVLACKGGRHDDGSAFMDVHGAGHTVRAEWSTDDAAEASADGTKIRVSVDGGATESLTLSNGVLVGPVGPWKPALKGDAPPPAVLAGDATKVVPEAGFWETLGGAIGGAIGAAIGAAAGGAAGAVAFGIFGAAAGGAIGRVFDI